MYDERQNDCTPDIIEFPRSRKAKTANDNAGSTFRGRNDGKTVGRGRKDS